MVQRRTTGIILGYILGLYRDSGKENGNKYNGTYIRVMSGFQGLGRGLGKAGRSGPCRL